MAFMTRLSRLLRADLHAMLDRLEAPDLVLAQAVREMEESLERGRQGLARLERRRARLQERAGELQSALSRSAQALEDCLAAGEDDLARPVIRRRLEAERETALLEQRRQSLEADCEARRQRLADQQARLADLRARAALYEETHDAEEGGDDEDWPTTGAAPVRGVDVEVALLQAKRRRGGGS